MPSERINGLDGLRAIALIAVVLSHLPVLTRGAAAAGDVHSHWIFKGGFLGVSLFFTLSGYFITTQLLERVESTGRISLKEFYVNRATRLWPALAVMLAAYASVVAMEGSPVTSLAAMYRSIALWIVNWHGSLGWSGFDGRLGHLWSLSVEEQFYVVWPLIFVILMKINRRIAVTGIALLCVMIAFWRARGHATGVFPLVLLSRTDFCLDAVLAGCFVALLGARRRGPFAGTRRSGVLGSIIVAGILLSVGPYTPWVYMGGLSVFTLGAALLIIAVIDVDFGRSVLANRQLRAIGRCSYGAYLWHLPIFFIVHDHATMLNTQARVAVALGATTILTALSWVLVEKPVLGLRPRILRSSSPVATTADPRPPAM